MRSWGWIAVTLAALPGGPVLAQEPPLAVVATVGMIGDIAQEIGGPCVAVTTLMGAGVDPHLYRASAQDVRTFQGAEVILYSGYSLEGQLGDVLERLAAQKPTVAVVETGVPPEDLIATGNSYGHDPHVWMDVSLWSRIVPVIADTIIAQRPGCAEAVSENAAHYSEQLAALDTWIGDSVATIPETQRVLVTAHDAFAYYGRAYGIDVAGIQGISTEAEASIADIRATAQQLVAAGIPAIFVETTINPRTIQAVIDAAAQQGHAVAVGGELYSDAMGDAGTAEGTYIGMLHANTLAIVGGLGGTPLPLPDELAGWAERFGLEPEAQP